MDVRHLIMDTCDLIYIHRPIMIFMIEVKTSIFFFSVRDVNGWNAKSE